MGLVDEFGLIHRLWESQFSLPPTATKQVCKYVFAQAIIFE